MHVLTLNLTACAKKKQLQPQIKKANSLLLESYETFKISSKHNAELLKVEVCGVYKMSFRPVCGTASVGECCPKFRDSISVSS